MHKHFHTASSIILAIILCGCATQPIPSVTLSASLDPAKATPSADGKTLWFSALDIGLEGQGWTTLNHPYDRLPVEAEGKVTEAVWNLAQHSAGISVRFMTDSPEISARWSLRSDRLAMTHMPATGVSGLDLYAKGADGAYHWLAVGRPEKTKENEATLIGGLPAGMHEYILYLPLYNGTESLDIGIQAGSTLGRGTPYPADRAKPMLFWGTSILHGGCASRPGMAYPSIIGRHMQRPVINLGFSGNGKMDPELVKLIAPLDVSVYVIDCAPNMGPALITERTEPLVHTLRAAHPETPIVLVENITYQQSWFLDKKKNAYSDKNAALYAAYQRLMGEGAKNLYYIPGDHLLGDDYEATVDGTHPTDVGFLRMAAVIEPVLRHLLKP